MEHETGSRNLMQGKSFLIMKGLRKYNERGGPKLCHVVIEKEGKHETAIYLKLQAYRISTKLQVYSGLLNRRHTEI